MSRPLVIERDRGQLRVTGRDPVRMIHGLVTADVTAVRRDQGAYGAFLTPKGKMVADARIFLRVEEPVALLLDVAPAALEPLQAHLRKYVPPLFARAEDVTAERAVVGVYGPGASAALAGAAASWGGAIVTGGDTAGGGAVGEEVVTQGAAEERVVEVPALGEGFAVRTRLTGGDGWDLFVPAGERERVVEALRGAGAAPGSPEALEALRVAAGVPRWGRELTEDVIPLEAGLLERAISQTKGCYTGQEVIVRILHRGHVNRHLRRLEFEGAAPEPGTELFEPGQSRVRGVVTSAVENEAGAIGLGYVRREIEPPAELRAGGPDGPAVAVEVLDWPAGD